MLRLLPKAQPSQLRTRHASQTPFGIRIRNNPAKILNRTFNHQSPPPPPPRSGPRAPPKGSGPPKQRRKRGSSTAIRTLDDDDLVGGSETSDAGDGDSEEEDSSYVVPRPSRRQNPEICCHHSFRCRSKFVPSQHYTAESGYSSPSDRRCMTCLRVFSAADRGVGSALKCPFDAILELCPTVE